MQLQHLIMPITVSFFWDLLKEVESSLRTNRDCLASLKCRTQTEQTRLPTKPRKYPQGRQDQKQHE